MNQQFRRQAALVAVNQAVDRRARINARRAYRAAVRAWCDRHTLFGPTTLVTFLAAECGPRPHTTTELRREPTVLEFSYPPSRPSVGLYREPIRPHVARGLFRIDSGLYRSCYACARNPSFKISMS